MKQVFLKYKDLLCVSEADNKHFNELRFDLTPLILFVIDS
jgi:hypothetical protein